MKRILSLITALSFCSASSILAADGPSTRLLLIAVSARQRIPEPRVDLDRIHDLCLIGSAQSGIKFSSPLAGVPQDPQQLPKFTRQELPDDYQIGVYTPDELFDSIRNQGPGDLSQATLVCYLKLHGEIVNDEHYFLLDRRAGTPQARVKRSTVVQELRNRGARHTVLITESCSHSDEPLFAGVVGADGFPLALFRALFVDPQEFVDINSATFKDYDEAVLNQRAWVELDGSAVFTSALLDYFTTRGVAQTELLTPLGSNPSWSSLYWPLRTRTDKYFSKLGVSPETQLHQYPHMFSPLPAPRAK